MGVQSQINITIEQYKYIEAIITETNRSMFLPRLDEIYWYNSFLIIIILVTITGNLLVVLAVMKNKTLQNTTNYFLTSLAIADFLVAIIVMPFSMITETLGFFPFNHIICNLWITSDVLLCTCSIWHMCVISMDRYFTIRFPFKYGRNKTTKYMFLKITLVWLFSLLLSSPIFFLGVINSRYVFNTEAKICALEHAQFQIYGSILAFYIPLLIIAITYSFTMKSLKQMMKSKEKNENDFKWYFRDFGSSSLFKRYNLENGVAKNESQSNSKKQCSFDLSSNRLNSCVTNLTNLSNYKLSWISADINRKQSNDSFNSTKRTSRHSSMIIDANSKITCNCLKCSQNTNKSELCVFARFKQRYSRSSSPVQNNSEKKASIKNIEKYKIKHNISKSLGNLNDVSFENSKYEILMDTKNKKTFHLSLLDVKDKNKLKPINRKKSYIRRSSPQNNKQFYKRLSLKKLSFHINKNSERFAEIKRLQKTLLHIENEMDNLLLPHENKPDESKVETTSESFCRSNLDEATLDYIQEEESALPQKMNETAQAQLQKKYSRMITKKRSSSNSSNYTKSYLNSRNNSKADMNTFKKSKYLDYQVQNRYFRANNERKALKVLIIIFVIFVVLWTPFFLFNILFATCSSCKFITPQLMSVSTWLGYVSSMANPIIYTVFNKSYRKAFINLLTCKTKYNNRLKQKLLLDQIYSHRNSRNSQIHK